MSSNIVQVEPANAKSPAYKRDRVPDPSILPGVGAVPGAPRDLVEAEALVLVALHRGARTVADVLATTDQPDVARAAVDRLVQRGLVGRGRDHESLLNLTVPVGEALAARLAEFVNTEAKG